jgi:hypothetical protein
MILIMVQYPRQESVSCPIVISFSYQTSRILYRLHYIRA